MKISRSCDGFSRLFLGIITGCSIIILTRLLFFTGILSKCASVPQTAEFGAGRTNDPLGHLKQPQRLLFVGVMTAQKYLDTRAVSVYRTWGVRVPGQMSFFSSEGSQSSDPDLPVIALPGVNDAYPPQKKSFLMLKYMYDHLVDEFEWFMRADDDVYVRTEKLELFLRSLNSSKPLFIGQAGMGNKDEIGLLNLAPGENFCMGGPGIIISREALRRMAPNIQYCLKHLYSTHEDVEIGRCFGKFAGVPCAWSYEMQTIFYHNGSGSAAFTGDLHSKEVHRAINLHPVKTSQHLYRMQNYFNILTGYRLRQDTLELQRDINNMNALLYDKMDSTLARPNLNRFRPESPDEVLEWEFFTKSLFSHLDYNPRRSPKTALKWALNDLIMQMMDSLNLYSKQRGRVIDFKNLLYGSQRVDPLHGVHYVLDLHLVYKRYSGRKMTAPVRRHAHLEQSFGPLQMVEEEDCRGSPPEIPDLKRDFTDVLRHYVPDQTHRKSMLSSDEAAEECDPVGNVTVNLIVPIAGRVETLRRFLQELETTYLIRNESLSLTVVNFPDGSDGEEGKRIRKLVETVAHRYPAYSIVCTDLAGNFSRARALQTGVSQFAAESLLFFVDVDMAVDQGVFERIRRFTKLGRMVYYPVVFSQYAPVGSGTFSENPFYLTEENGYWRQFGFGIASMYRSDFDAVGGFDLTITGWGKEDVDLFEKIIRHSQNDSRFSVFRAADPGLVHIYHPIVCDPGLDEPQTVMCHGTRAASMSSERAMARFLLDHPDLLRAGWRANSLSVPVPAQ